MSTNNVLWNKISNEFRAAVAILPNNLRIPCVECRGCSLRILNPNEIRISKHREVCPSRIQFKYIYPSNAGERLTVKCLLCSEIINSTAIAILLCHRRKCMPPQSNPSGSEPQIYYLSNDELFNSCEVNVQLDESNPNEVSTQVEVSNEVVVEAENLNELDCTVRRSSIRTWDTEAGKFDFKIVRVREENGTIKRCMQCLICSRIIRTVGRVRVISHRNVCFRRTLVTTMTIPHNGHVNGDNDEIQEVKKCFICDASVEIHLNSDKRDHVNLYDTNTSHTNTPIYDLVWKFLGEKPSQRNLIATEAESHWNCVCLNCFQNIEEYDFATCEAQRLEKFLMEKLSITEKAYEERNNVEDNVENIDTDGDAQMTENANDIEIIEADDDGVELIISDDECDEMEENSQLQQIIVQSSQTVIRTPRTVVLQSPQPTQKDKESDEIIELISDDGASDSDSGDEVELVEQCIPDPLSKPDQRILTFNEL